MISKSIFRRSIGFVICFLTFMMLFFLVPADTFAAGNVASVNGVEYSSINDAWNKVKGGGTITMLQDWNTGDLLKVNENANVTVEMNGHIINRGKADTSYSGNGDGQIFFVNNGASLTVNGGPDTEHAGYRDGDLWFSGQKSGKQSVTLTGGILTGGACDDSDGAGAISMKKGTTVTLNNVNVVGNVSDCYLGSYGQAGGIRMYDPEAVLNLNNSKIMYNHAEDDGGGIYIQDDTCTVNMVHSEISHNYADGDGGGIYSNDTKTVIRMTEDSKIDGNTADEGGGIYLNYSNFKVRSADMAASVSNNKAADGHGGGIYIAQYMFHHGDKGEIHGLLLDHNSADDYAGGIYLNQEGTVVTSCTITNNSSKEGAGIYNNNDKNAVSSCIITGNKASSQGGGVFSSCMNDLSFSGKMIVKNNTRSDGSMDDLFLNDSLTTDAYLEGAPAVRSEVGIRVSSPKERKLGGKEHYYYEDAFFYDLGDDYHVEFKEDKGELWLVKGPKEVFQPAEVGPETVKAGRYNGETLTQGYFSYQSVVESEKDLTAPFYYSDGYFLNGEDGKYGDPAVYNNHLATMSMAMAMSGFSSNIGNDQKLTKGSDRTYTYKSQNIERLFQDIGISEDDIYISETHTAKPGTDTIGCAIGQKPVGTDGEILVPIAVRGAGYESEWYSNTTLGLNGEAEGFASAANQVQAMVKNYIRDYGLQEAAANGKLKFWIAGYSRAGATSNLTARRLIEEYCSGEGDAGSNQVYSYCFEAPKGGMNSEMKLPEDKYYSIHNCINNADLVPLVGPEEMGFIRYGVDHYIPGSAEAGEIRASSTVWSYVKDQPWAAGYKTWSDNKVWSVGTAEYNTQRAKMKAQLASVDPENIYFYDRFRPATINYVLSSALNNFDLISEIDDTSLKQEQYNRIFIRALQSWGFYASYNRDLRKSYAAVISADITTGDATFQECLQTVTKLLFSKSAGDLDGMVDAASGTLERIDEASDISMSDIYDDCIGDWCSLSQEDRDDYSAKLWKIVVEDKGVDGDSVADYLTQEEKAELRGCWDTLLDVVFRLVASDYEFDADEWNESHAMVTDPSGKFHTTPVTENIGGLDSSKCQVLLGTFANNSSTILQAHYPEVNLAWLRSYDSFYDNQAKKQVRLKDQKAPVMTYSASQDGSTWETAVEHYEGDRLLKVSTKKEGAGVYYRIRKSDEEFGCWMPFNKPLELKICNDAPTDYIVETTAVYCGAVTEPVQKTYTVEPIRYYAIAVTDGTASADGEAVKEASGNTVITLKADDAQKGRHFDKWVSEQGTVSFKDENAVTTTFIMPPEAVSVKATYCDCVYDQETVSEEALKNPASCTEDAVYYKSCLCGQISETETFKEEGSALGHKLSDWKSDRFTHWKVCTREDCGVLIKDTQTSHTSGKWIIDKQSEGTSLGLRHKECAICGRVLKTGTFRNGNKPVHTVSFTDVPESSYFHDAVAWAVDLEITNGISEDLFGPKLSCTRGQMVTLLYRKAGCPESSVNAAEKFTDVKTGAYYEDAVAWAVEEGITNGISETEFAPDEIVSRAQVVTFLHRYEGLQKSGQKNPFTDVAPGSYYYDAVVWAVENDITKGISEDLFAPDGECARAQIVTFLHRISLSE